MPWGAAPPWGMPANAYVSRILYLLEAEMPIEEVLHSLHVEATLDPELRDHPAMKRFSESSLNHLHATAATAGFLRRILGGDASELVWTGLREQALLLHTTDQAARSAFEQLRTLEAARQNRAIESMRQVLASEDQAHQTIVPALQALLPRVAPERKQPREAPPRKESGDGVDRKP